MLWHFAYFLAWPRNAWIFAYKPHIPTPPHTHAHTYTYISSRSIAAINRPSFIIFNENRQRCQLQPQPITTTESNTHKWIVLVFVVFCCCCVLPHTSAYSYTLYLAMLSNFHHQSSRLLLTFRFYHQNISLSRPLTLARFDQCSFVTAVTCVIKLTH